MRQKQLAFAYLPIDRAGAESLFGFLAAVMNKRACVERQLEMPVATIRMTGLSLDMNVGSRTPVGE